MRAWLLALGALVLVACTGESERGEGGLWARQAVLQEVAVSRTPDALRSAHARALEMSDVDATLTQERARLDAALRDCPGTTRQILALSPANRTRDGVRLRLADDAARRATLAGLALADWRLRRAQATGDAQFCDAARAALAAAVSPSGTPAAAGSSARAFPALESRTGDIPRALATVVRDATDTSVLPDDTVSADVAFARYVLGWSDAVRTQTPMPQYLAGVYGGTVVGAPPPHAEADAAVTVDRLAPEYPDWEPDALYLALR